MSLDCQLHFTAGFKNNRTFLQESYYTHPYKLANVTEDKSSSTLQLMLMSSSPGILDGDKYHIEIQVEKLAKLRLTTQGYQRIFTMNGAAFQQVSVNVCENSSFYYLPHPNVPHKDADFTSNNTIHLQATHELLWSEITTCGRKLSGEEFLFKRYKNVTNIFIDGKLAIRENVLHQPQQCDLSAMGHLGGYSHQSSLLFLHHNADVNLIAEECRGILLEEDIVFGISNLPINGLIIRMLGYKGEQLYNLHNELATTIRELTERQVVPEKTVSPIL